MSVLKKYPFVKHLLFWLSVLFIYTISKVSEDKELYPNIVFSIAVITPQIIAAYLTVYGLLPLLLEKKKYVTFTLLMLANIYLLSVLARIVVVHIAEPIVITKPFEQEPILEIFSDISKLITHYFPTTFNMVGFFWLFTFFVKNSADTELEKEKTSAELKALKSQLNPHFLFNTLNNIYSLSLDNSPKTSESIGKLSEILDYILYRCDSKLVLLSNEITLLENYISLEKLRYDDRLQLTFRKEVEQDMEIAPLILLSLVENAFKHGAGEDGGSPKIDIFLSSQSHENASGKKMFIFEISNTIVKNDIEKQKSIGLKNIKKQLGLIYANHYQLTIKDEDNLFIVKLEI